MATSGTPKGPANRAQIVQRARRLDEKRVCTRVLIRLAAPQCRVQAFDSCRVAARDDDQVRVATRRERGTDLSHHLLGGYDLFALEMAAAFRKHLVLDVQTGDAGPFVLLDGAANVERPAVACVRVGDDGKGRRRADARRLARHLGHRREAQIGLAEQAVRRAGAGHVDHVKAGLLDQPRGEPVVRAGRDDDAFTGEELAQAETSLIGHHRAPF